MAEKLSVSDGRDRKTEKIKFLLRKEFYLKYIVLGDEINNKRSSDISPTIKYKLQIP